MMTEQEAKGLAAELEHQRYWRVLHVYENPSSDHYWPEGWVVQLEHRTCAGMCKWVYGIPLRMDVFAQVLNEDGRYYADATESRTA